MRGRITAGPTLSSQILINFSLAKAALRSGKGSSALIAQECHSHSGIGPFNWLIGDCWRTIIVRIR